MLKNVAVFAVLGLILVSGCGLVSVFGTPGYYEKKVPAEYQLGEHKDEKILVLAYQPAYLSTEVSLRYYVTEMMNRLIEEKVKFPSKNFVSYDELSQFRSERMDFAELSATEIGKALGADMVMVVMIDNSSVRELEDTGYYSGYMATRVSLMDVGTDKQVWPDNDKAKIINVGFEVEKRGKDAVVTRLAKACAYCTVRYLYDCKKARFSISDDRSKKQWQQWGNN